MFPLMKFIYLVDIIKFLLSKYQIKTKSLSHRSISSTAVRTKFRYTIYSGKQKMNIVVTCDLVSKITLVAIKSFMSVVFITSLNISST